MTKAREEQIIKASQLYAKALQKPFMDGAIWADANPQNLWLDAQGDDLPEIDREVIVLCDFGFGGYMICFAHRPNPKGRNGRSISTGMVDHYTPQAYGKGGWNIPDVKLWLDLDLTKMEDEE